MEWEILYYRKENLRSPVEEYIDDQAPKTQAKLLRNLLLLSEFGPDIGWPLVTNVRRNIWELRTVVQGNQHRILFTVLPDKRLLMLHAFKKKTDKISNRDISIAIDRLKEYKED